MNCTRIGRRAIIATLLAGGLEATTLAQSDAAKSLEAAMKDYGTYTYNIEGHTVTYKLDVSISGCRMVATEHVDMEYSYIDSYGVTEKVTYHLFESSETPLAEIDIDSIDRGYEKDGWVRGQYVSFSLQDNKDHIKSTISQYSNTSAGDVQREGHVHSQRYFADADGNADEVEDKLEAAARSCQP